VLFVFHEAFMAYSNNGTITNGTTAQDALAAGHQFGSIAFTNESDTAIRVRVGAVATSTTGCNVPAGAEKLFSRLMGQRVSLYCATTGKAFSFREA
jgi:hypothetical protein